MAAIRAFGILLSLLGFFLIGAPLQALVARQAPSAAHRIPIFFCRSILWLLKVRTSLEGTRVKDRPVLMVANHVSWIDILALGGIMPFCFLAKSEVAGWPILSAFAKVQGTVFVDRKRRRTILEANRQMATRMLEGRSVLFFPEGTTLAGRDPGPFLSSHFAAARDALRLRETLPQIDVQAVAIGYSSPDAAWVGDDALLPHLWRTLRAPPLHCTIAFAPPIAYVSGSDRKLIARHSRQAVVDALSRQRRLAPTPSPRTIPDLAEAAN